MNGNRKLEKENTEGSKRNESFIIKKHTLSCGEQTKNDEMELARETKIIVRYY